MVPEPVHLNQCKNTRAPEARVHFCTDWRGETPSESFLLHLGPRCSEFFSLLMYEAQVNDDDDDANGLCGVYCAQHLALAEQPHFPDYRVPNLCIFVLILILFCRVVWICWCCLLEVLRKYDWISHNRRRSWSGPHI